MADLGEHIDYSGYSVFPMAIERDMVMAVSSKPGSSCVANSNEKYGPRVFEASPDIAIDSSVHEWSNYFLCGFKGVTKALSLAQAKPMQVLCQGTVPTVIFFNSGWWSFFIQRLCLLFSRGYASRQSRDLEQG